MSLFSGFSKLGHGAFGQGGKGVVRGGEHGERAFALQRIDKTSGLNRSNQRGKAASLYGGIDDVFAMTIGQRGARDQGGGGDGEVSSAKHMYSLLSQVFDQCRSTLCKGYAARSPADHRGFPAGWI